MSILSRISVAVLSMAIARPATMRAQVVSSSTGPDSVVRSLRTSQRVRVSSGGRRVSGRVIQRDSRTIMIATDSGDETIHWGSIDSVWLRRDRAKRGAIIGGIASGILVASTVSALAADPASGAPVLVPVSLIVGAIPGALIGGAVGSFFQRWVQGYPR